METRDILDINGEIIGQCSMPDGTSEEDWVHKLGPYTYVVPAPITPSLNQIVDAALAAAQSEGLRLIAEFKRTNVLLGITQAGKTKQVSDYCHWMNHYLEQGSLYAAIEQLDIMIADSNRASMGLNPFITDDILNHYRSEVRSYLGLQ